MAGIVATLADFAPGISADGLKTERYTLTNGAPTVAVASGAGTGGTMTIKAGSTDAAGQIIITTGTAIPGGGGTIGVVTFANTLAGTPSPVLFPADTNSAALLAGTSSPWALATTTTFSILAGSATASTAYTFNYSVPDAKVNLAITSRWVQGSDAYAIGEGVGIASQSFSNGTATIGLRPNFTAGALKLAARNG